MGSLVVVRRPQPAASARAAATGSLVVGRRPPPAGAARAAATWSLIVVRRPPPASSARAAATWSLVVVRRPPARFRRRRWGRSSSQGARRPICIGLRIVPFWLNITVDRRVRTVSAGASVGTCVSIGLQESQKKHSMHSHSLLCTHNLRGKMEGKRTCREVRLICLVVITTAQLLMLLR